MTALLDGRPPGVDAWFRPGKTFSFTMPWEAGALDGRTFTATLDSEDLAVTVAGDSLIFEATAAQTTTLGVGGHDFTLVETTGGGTEPIVIGNWAGSTHAAIAAVSDTITVAESAGTVEVSLVDGTANAVKLTGDQTVAGAKTFTSTPVIPIAAVGSLGAASLQDVFEQLAGVRQYDIRDFGATASAARTGLQAALDEAALAAAFGLTAVVWVPPGTWQLSYYVVVPNNTTLRGVPGKSILRLDDGVATAQPADAMLCLGHYGYFDTDIENITVKGLVLDGNKANADPDSDMNGIITTSRTTTSNVRLRDLVVKDMPGYGLGFQGNRARFENVLLDGVHVENVGTDGVDTKGIAARNCSMRNIGVHYFGQAAGVGSKAAIDIRTTWTLSNIDIRGVDNDFFQNHYGIRLHGENGAERAPAVGCTVEGVSVALTGASVTRAVAETTATGGVTAQGNTIGSIAYKRATDVKVTEGGDATDASSYQTESVTPPPNVLLLLAVTSSASPTASAPTVTGCGLTWTQVATHSPAAVNRLTVFRAMGYFHTPPTAGPITIDFGGVTQLSCQWRLDAIENVSVISETDAIVQSATAGGNALTAANATLAAFDHAYNSTWSAWVSYASVVAPTPEAGNLLRTGTNYSTNRLLSTMIRPDNDTTPGVTYGAATNVSGVAVELRVARA